MIPACARLTGLILLALAAARPGAADDSHDAALAALRAGQIVPLHEVLALPAVREAGAVVEVEIEREQGRWVYEIETVAPDGTLRKLRFDAATRAALPAEAHEE